MGALYFGSRLSFVENYGNVLFNSRIIKDDCFWNLNRRFLSKDMIFLLSPQRRQLSGRFGVFSLRRHLWKCHWNCDFQKFFQKLLKFWIAINFYSHFLCVICRLLLRGYRKSLEFEDVYDLPSYDKTEKIYPVFEGQWKKAQARYFRL